jgi:hypothetical protein
LRASVLGQPHPPADIQVQRGDQQQPHHDGVEQDAERDRETQLGQAAIGRTRHLHVLLVGADRGDEGSGAHNGFLSILTKAVLGFAAL